MIRITCFVVEMYCSRAPYPRREKAQSPKDSYCSSTLSDMHEHVLGGYALVGAYSVRPQPNLEEEATLPYLVDIEAQVCGA